MNTSTVLPLDPVQRKKLETIIQQTERLTAKLEHHTDADISAAVKTAADCFFQNQSGANCVYSGYDHARQRIKTRRNNTVVPFPAVVAVRGDVADLNRLGL